MGDYRRINNNEAADQATFIDAIKLAGLYGTSRCCPSCLLDFNPTSWKHLHHNQSRISYDDYLWAQFNGRHLIRKPLFDVYQFNLTARYTGLIEEIREEELLLRNVQVATTEGSVEYLTHLWVGHRDDREGTLRELNPRVGMTISFDADVYQYYCAGNGKPRVNYGLCGLRNIARC